MFVKIKAYIQPGRGPIRFGLGLGMSISVFVHFLFALGSQRKHSFWWNMDLTILKKLVRLRKS